MLSSRIEEGNPGDREQVGAFVQIAEGTSVSKVPFAGRPSVLLRDHVVYVMAKMLWPKAILASVPGMLGYDA